MKMIMHVFEQLGKLSLCCLHHPLLSISGEMFAAVVIKVRSACLNLSIIKLEFYESLAVGFSSTAFGGSKTHGHLLQEQDHSQTYVQSIHVQV